MTSQLSEASQTLYPLPPVLSHGLVAVSTFGLLSFFCSTSLFLFLTYRLLRWQFTFSRGGGPSTKPALNQFLFLIYNLLLADIQQAIAFLLNISALRTNSINVESPTCFAQGWFVSTGDLASSVFISAIAVHTFMGVVREYRMPNRVFYGCIAGCWTFVYLLAALGPALHGRMFYARASAWCWINDAYQTERLWLHYFWIFIFMFGTVLIYFLIFLYLRANSRKNLPSPTVHGATPLMILYPLIYVICTAPLAAGRIAALAGNNIGLSYFCAAGTMIACNGWLDVLLYASTRADIVFSEYPPGEETGIETFRFMGKAKRLGTVTTIEAGGNGRGTRMGRRRDSESVENLYGLDQIGIKGEVTVSVERGVIKQSERLGLDNIQREDEPRESWDTKSRKSSERGQS